MLKFTPVQVKNAPKLQKYYRRCDYRLCEYSVGVKLMWRQKWRPAFAESHGCLVVCNRSRHFGFLFDYPVPLPGMGDVHAALDDIDTWCLENGVLPAYGCVPRQGLEMLLERYPYTIVDNGRIWQDYLYRTEDLIHFSGRRYSGQRNHINKFRKLYPDARFRPLTAEDQEVLERFWEEYFQSVHRDNADARMESCFARRLMRQTGKSWVKAGAIDLHGKLLAVSLGEICGDTLICHIEKGLPEYEGVYPTMVQSFAACYGKGLTWINREDDAGERGLRTSKTQYLPATMGEKLRVLVRNELAYMPRLPVLKTERLTLDALTEADIPLYNRLCLDDERNRWWGYDYRDDLTGEWTEDYFFRVVCEDFQKKTAVNLAIRLDGRLIGETVLYRFDGRGGAELGCRILPEYAGKGYGREAFQRMAEWSLYTLGLHRLKAKCYHENTASRTMLESCMRPAGQDETFLYFEKLV